jgi:hypothetical protein
MLGVQQVDSRAYAHAYRIRSLSDLPGDFPVRAAQDGFDLGVFLPMDQLGGSEGPRFPARILLLVADGLVCATHPSERRGEVRIARDDVLALEAGQFLLSMWMRVFTAYRSYWWPFAAHNADVVEGFLRRLKGFLFADVRLQGFGATPAFGGPLSFKLANAESDEVEPDERILLRFWFGSPATGKTRRGKAPSPPGQDYLAVTNRRLLWITDRQNGRAQPYGTIRRSFPVAHISHIDFLSGREDRVCEISLARGIGWHIVVPAQDEENARAFVAEAQRLL